MPYCKLLYFTILNMANRLEPTVFPPKQNVYFQNLQKNNFNKKQNVY